MATKIETTIAELPLTLAKFPGERKVRVEIEDSDEEKIASLNTMLKRNRASGAPVDGEEALAKMRDGYLAKARAQSSS